MQKTKKSSGEQKSKRTTSLVERTCKHKLSDDSLCEVPFKTRVKVIDPGSGRQLCKRHHAQVKSREATAKRRAERMRKHCEKCDMTVTAIFIRSTPTPSDAKPPQRIHCPHCYHYIETGNARGVYAKMPEVFSLK